MAESMLRQWQQQYAEQLERHAALLEAARLRKEAKQRAAREKLARQAQQRVDQLLDEAAAWRRVVDLRVFIRARLDQSLVITNLEQQAELEAWARWASDIANTIDPLCRK